MRTSVARHGWMVDHEDDLEADFLALYGLDQDDLDGPRWVRLAQRISAYGGVMARIVEQGQSARPAPTVARSKEEREVTLAELRLGTHGLVSVARGTEIE